MQLPVHRSDADVAGLSGDHSRLSAVSRGDLPGFVGDAAASIGWVRREIATSGGDPGRVVVAGHSVGVHSAALLALDRTYLEKAGVPQGAIAGWAGLAGPYAFDPSRISNTRPLFATAYPPAAVRLISSAHAGAPPTLLIHGEQDCTVSIRYSEELAKRLRDVGNQVRYVPVADISHGGFLLGLAEPFQPGSQMARHITDFVDPLDSRTVPS